MTQPESREKIPWYVWCGALAVTSVTVGVYWDISWHRSIGRDTFWTPPHIAIQLCGVLAAVCCGYLILNTTFRRPAKLSAASVQIFGFRAPLGAFLMAWGGIAMIASAPFDNWWHNAYGLDVEILSPPHTILVVGIWTVSVGVLVLIAGELNRLHASGPVSQISRRMQTLMLYVGAVMLALEMIFFTEYTWDTRLHTVSPYEVTAVTVTILFALLSRASRHRWAATWAALVYTLFVIGMILILPLFPAQPKLGPVYHQVTHFIPPKFPLLLLAPAIALDLLWSRTTRLKPWLTALISGPVFVLTFVGVEWPFADFLMSKSSQNRFFGTGYHDYLSRSWSAEVLRHLEYSQHGVDLWIGLAKAMLAGAVCTWIGLRLGNWMRTVQR